MEQVVGDQLRQLTDLDYRVRHGGGGSGEMGVKDQFPATDARVAALRKMQTMREIYTGSLQHNGSGPLVRVSTAGVRLRPC